MNSSLLSFFFLFSILGRKSCFGVRTMKNRAFTGLILERVHDVDWLGCIAACSLNEKCASYNYKWRPSAEEVAVFVN